MRPIDQNQEVTGLFIENGKIYIMFNGVAVGAFATAAELGAGVCAAALSGDLAVNAAGVVTLANPQRVLSSSKTINKDGTGVDGAIVGSSAGQLGEANGVTLVAAVANKVIAPLAILVNYARDTAAYTGGGNVTAGYADGAAATGLVSAAALFGAAASSIQALAPLSGAALVNKALVLRAASAFTQPGTAAGIAVVTTYYRLIDA